MKFIWLSLSFILSVDALGFELGNYPGGLSMNLKFVLAIPSSPSSKVFIFVEGDGDVCYPFEPEKIGSMADSLSTKDYWVVPESAKQRMCGTPEFRKLDFFYRLTELQNLTTSLRQDPRFSTAKFYLFGHSAGVDLASQALLDFEEIEGVILIGGSSLNLESMIYNKFLIDGHHAGLGDLVIQEQINEQKAIFDQIKSNCSAEESVWGTRSNLFWCQLINLDVGANLIQSSSHKKILIIHGIKDAIVPVEEAYALFSRLQSQRGNVKLRVFPEMDHSPFSVFSDILKEIENYF